MNRIIKYIAVAVLCLAAMPIWAQETDNETPIPVADKWERWGPTSRTGFGFQLKMGYSIGGYSPLPIPREIRQIQKFSPQGGISAGVECYKMFNRRWGLKIGVTLANQGFTTKAEVKNYYTKIVKYDPGLQKYVEQKGWFTGINETSINNWTITIPVMVTLRMSSRWNVSLGPYMQMFLSKNFDATVHGFPEAERAEDAYLRVDHGDGSGPTQDKNIFFPDAEPITTPLGDDMLTCTAGVELLFDWKITKHIGAFGKLDWGFTSIFPGDYDTVRFKMFPIFGTIGGAYCF